MERKGMGEARVDIRRWEGGEKEFREELYKAAKSEDLEEVIRLLREDKWGGGGGPPREVEWEVNPLKGVIEGEKGRIRVAEVLLEHYGDFLLLKARCPQTGNTLLHLAAQPHKEKLAVFILKYLSDPLVHDPLTKQSFLDAVNDHGQTALHLATSNLLIPVVKQFVEEKQLRINIKDSEGQTVFDVINGECSKRKIRDDWKKPWQIAIMLRGYRAQYGKNLKDYKHEESVMKKERPAETLIMNDSAWNSTTNTILLVATLAFTLVFAAIFTVPQTLASGGGGGDSNTSTQSVIQNLHSSLGKSVPFIAFIVVLSLACLVMIFVTLVLLMTVTSKYEKRALILCFSWLCVLIMGGALIIGYLIVVWIYLGYLFTSILIACGVSIALIMIFIAYLFDLLSEYWATLSTLLSLTLLHGLVVTVLHTYLPNYVVQPILYVLPFGNDDLSD